MSDLLDPGRRALSETGLPAADRIPVENGWWPAAASAVNRTRRPPPRTDTCVEAPGPAPHRPARLPPRTRTTGDPFVPHPRIRTRADRCARSLGTHVRVPPVARRRHLGRHRVVLIGSVAAFGGKLRDEFKIPGSDVQKGQDLIDKKFVTRKGATLTWSSPPRPASGSTRRSARRPIAKALRRRRASRDEGRASRRDRGRRPVHAGPLLGRRAGSRTPRRSSTARLRHRAPKSSTSRKPCARTSRPRASR